MGVVLLIIYVFLPLAAYLLGSVPFAFVIGKAHGVDIRTVGSKNIGATNLGRTLGKKYFWQAFFLDALKGFLPALAASLFVANVNASLASSDAHRFVLYAANNAATDPTTIPSFGPIQSWSPLISAVAAVVGHLFPVWLKFKGGKGVATGFGAVLGIWPLFTIGGIVGAVVFVFTLFVYRYISLASMVGAAAFAGAATFLAFHDVLPVKTSLAETNRWPILVTAWLFVVMIVLRHKGNIGRLLKGTEPTYTQRQNEKEKGQ